MKKKSLDDDPVLLAELRAQCKKQYLEVRANESTDGRKKKSKIIKLPVSGRPKLRPALEM